MGMRFLKGLVITILVIALLVFAFSLSVGVVVYLGILPIVSEELAKLPICSNDIQALAIIVSASIIVISSIFIFKRKQLALISFIVILMIIRAGFGYYMSKDHYMGKFYVYDSQTGQYSVLDRPITDRLGRKYEPITIDIAVLIIESKNRDLYPQEEIPFNKINAFFSESNGFPLIHYSQDMSGIYHFYHRHGFDALTGDRLKPVTAEVVEAGRIQTLQRLAKARALQQAREVELERAKQLARMKVLANQQSKKKSESVALIKPGENRQIAKAGIDRVISQNYPKVYNGPHSLFNRLDFNRLDLFDFCYLLMNDHNCLWVIVIMVIVAICGIGLTISMIRDY